jgi:hypothetical protein
MLSGILFTLAGIVLAYIILGYGLNAYRNYKIRKLGGQMEELLKMMDGNKKALVKFEDHEELQTYFQELQDTRKEELKALQELLETFGERNEKTWTKIRTYLFANNIDTNAFSNEYTTDETTLYVYDTEEVTEDVRTLN